MTRALENATRSTRLFLGLLGVLILGLTGCTTEPWPAVDVQSASAKPHAELRVSAATSLKKVFERLAPRFEQENGVVVVLNFAASGVLQKQIEGGAPADVFASAGATQVDALIDRSLVSAEETAAFAANDLVIIVPAGSTAGIAGPDDLSKADRIATGNPDTAPHGAKAKAWLEGLGTWNALEWKFAFAENAAQTIDYVARGEVDAGIVFASEAKGRRDVVAVHTADIDPSTYVIATLKDAEQPGLAKAWTDYVMSETGRKALTEAGFRLP